MLLQETPAGTQGFCDSQGLTGRGLPRGVPQTRLRASWALGLQTDHFSSRLPFALSPSCLCSSLDCSKLLWARGYGRKGGKTSPTAAEQGSWGPGWWGWGSGRHPNHLAAQKPPCQRPQPLPFQHSGRSLGCHQELGPPGPPGTGVREGDGGGECRHTLSFCLTVRPRGSESCLDACWPCSVLLRQLAC